MRCFALTRVAAAAAAALLPLLVQVAPAAAQGNEGAPPNTAEDDQLRANAREIGKQAVADYRAHNFEAALDGFSRAHAMVGLTTTGLWRARSLEKVGRFVEASEQFLEVRRMRLDASASDKHRAAQGEAASEREALMRRIPRLTLRLPQTVPEDVTVLLDGKPLPAALIGVQQLVDPGHHLVVVKRGANQTQQQLDLPAGESSTLDLEIPAAPTVAPVPVVPKPISQTPGRSGGALGTVGWVLAGTGAAGLIVGGITGGLALDRKTTLDESCLEGRCGPALHEDVDAFDTLKLTSTIGFIAGGVLAATGLTLVIVDAAGGEEQATAPGPGGGVDKGNLAPVWVSLRLQVLPTGMALQGRF